MRDIGRRDFLKAAPVAAGAIAFASADGTAGDSLQSAPARQAHNARIGDAAYTAVPDYPRHAIPYFDVHVTDRFWRRKIDTNASVSIPLEVRKLTETPRGLNGNVLEAAILSLRTHPNPALQAVVDQRIGELRRQRWSGNSAFELAAAYYMTTGRRDLLDNAVAAAALLYENFATSTTRITSRTGGGIWRRRPSIRVLARRGAASGGSSPAPARPRSVAAGRTRSTSSASAPTQDLPPRCARASSSTASAAGFCHRETNWR